MLSNCLRYAPLTEILESQVPYQLYYIEFYYVKVPLSHIDFFYFKTFDMSKHIFFYFNHTCVIVCDHTHSKCIQSHLCDCV